MKFSVLRGLCTISPCSSSTEPACIKVVSHTTASMHGLHVRAAACSFPAQMSYLTLLPYNTAALSYFSVLQYLTSQ